MILNHFISLKLESDNIFNTELMALLTLYRIQFNQFALFLLLLKKRLKSTKNKLTQKLSIREDFFQDEIKHIKNK